MASPISVTDNDDARLADYRQLRDVSLRRRLETEAGLFIAEGEKVVRRAVEAGFPVRSFLMAPRWLNTLDDLISASSAPCYVADESLVESITGFHVHRGALASLYRLPLPTVAEVIANARRIVVLEDLVDHTNLGAIVRSATAFGFEAMVLSPRCADPLYRRSIKVAMGAVFSLPYARMADWYTGLDDLKAAGFTTLALTPASDALGLDVVDLPRDAKVAVVFGTEGDGLSPLWQAQADIRVKIPMAAGVDSLNVGAAAAVTLYALRR